MADEREEALKQLRAACEPDSLPKLESDELDQILDNHIRAKTWAPNTFFSAGTVIYPTTRTGIKYRVIRSGITGPEEPGWSLFDGSTISGTVTLDSDGEEYPSTYDVKGAIKSAWLKKAAKATRFMATGGMDMSQIRQSCLEMAKQYDVPMLG